jgi:hypothetical protein
MWATAVPLTSGRPPMARLDIRRLAPCAPVAWWGIIRAHRDIRPPSAGRGRFAAKRRAFPAEFDCEECRRLSVTRQTNEGAHIATDRLKRNKATGQTPEGGAMATNEPAVSPMEEPLAGLERELITAYVAGAGEDLAVLLERNDDHARQLLAEASLFATARLTEVESRFHYLRSLRGEL